MKLLDLVFVAIIEYLVLTVYFLKTGFTHSQLASWSVNIQISCLGSDEGLPQLHRLTEPHSRVVCKSKPSQRRETRVLKFLPGHTVTP